MKERFYKNKIERFRAGGGGGGWICDTYSDCDDETSLKDCPLIELLIFLIYYN